MQDISNLSSAHLRSTTCHKAIAWRCVSWMTRQSFFADTPSSRMLSQFELVFSYVQNNTSSAADRAQLLKEIWAPQQKPKPKQQEILTPERVHQLNQEQPLAPAQLELSLTQPEPVNANDPSAPAPVVAKKQRAQETKPRKRNHRLIIAAGMSERETSAIITEEEWAAFVSTAPVHQRGDKTRQAYAESPYRPSVAKDKDEKPHVSLSSGVGAIFDAEVWGSMSDADGVVDPLPAHKECKSIMPDGGFGCVNPKLPGKAYCQHHLGLYCAKNAIQRDRLDAATRQRQVQLIAPEDVRLARSKVRASNSNAGKGWKNLNNIRLMSAENRLAAAE